MNQPEIENPLVSIVVITYNSAEYVLETLESARAQTYRNIELIVSDDCSTDDTLMICRNWITENKDRFVRTELITSEQNTGISPNANRGLYAAKGEWLKFIAGDDVLTNNAIEILQRETISSNNIFFLFGTCKKIINGVFQDKIEFPDAILTKLDAKKQFKYLLNHTGKIHGPTSFINRNKLIELNGFDERIPFSEDWPLWINATKNCNKLYFIKNQVAFYRISKNGIFSKTKIGFVPDSRLAKSINLIREIYLIPNLKKERLYFDAFHWWIFVKKETSNNKINQIFFKSFLLLSPRFYQTILKKIIRLYLPSNEKNSNTI